MFCDTSRLFAATLQATQLEVTMRRHPIFTYTTRRQFGRFNTWLPLLRPYPFMIKYDVLFDNASRLSAAAVVAKQLEMTIRRHPFFTPITRRLYNLAQVCVFQLTLYTLIMCPQVNETVQNHNIAILSWIPESVEQAIIIFMLPIVKLDFIQRFL